MFRRGFGGGLAGVPGYDASSWQMIVMPAKTPKEIVGELNAAPLTLSPRLR